MAFAALRKINISKLNSPFLQRMRLWKGFFFDLFLVILYGGMAFFRLHAYSDPPGLNGYFYLKQTKTLAEGGVFYFSDHSLAFIPLVLFRLLTGDELLAFQLAVAAAIAFAVAGICFFVNQLRLAGWEKACEKLIVLTALFSSSYFSEFALNFFKNLLAAALLVWCAGLLLGKKKKAAAGFFLLAFLTHKSVALLGAIYFLFTAGERLFAEVRERGLGRKVFLLTASFVLAALVFGALFLWHFPKALAFLKYAETTFSGPAARLHWWKGVFSRLPFRGLEVVAWIALAGGLLYCRPRMNREARSIAATLVVLAVLALHPFQVPGADSLGYRMMLLMPLLLYPMAALLMEQKRIFIFLPFLAAVPVLAPLGFSVPAVKKQVRAYSEMRADVEKIKETVRTEDHLTCHHGMEFFVDYVTGIRCRSFLASEDFTGRRFRLAFIPSRWKRNEMVDDEIAQVKLLNVGADYVLLPEADWEYLKVNFPRSWKNPSYRRPSHVYE